MEQFSELRTRPDGAAHTQRGSGAVSWRNAVQPALRMLLQQDTHVDPYLEILRLGVEHEDIEARDVVVTLALDGALVTGVVISTADWEWLHLRQLEGYHDTLRKVLRDAAGHLDAAAVKGRLRRQVDPRFLHLRDVTHTVGRTTHTLPTWRGPITAVSGWSLGEPAKE